LDQGVVRWTVAELGAEVSGTSWLVIGGCSWRCWPPRPSPTRTSRSTWRAWAGPPACRWLWLFWSPPAVARLPHEPRGVAAFVRRHAGRMTRWFTADLHLGHANIIEYSSRPSEAASGRPPRRGPWAPCTRRLGYRTRAIRRRLPSFRRIARVVRRAAAMNGAGAVGKSHPYGYW